MLVHIFSWFWEMSITNPAGLVMDKMDFGAFYCGLEPFWDGLVKADLKLHSDAYL